MMMLQLLHFNPSFHYHKTTSLSSSTATRSTKTNPDIGSLIRPNLLPLKCRRRRQPHQWRSFISSSIPPLDLTEDNINQVLTDARAEFPQIFDPSVNITGEVRLVELDGPFVTIGLKGRFWHTRATVLARIGNYLKQRIPEIMEVDIEDEKQLDDSPENF
ncbi:uncharacterized protein LOC124910214 [Impatiens glandulifera]|uniref:uncharacterized protein LOC124910214 n=1 Tax=Impatiens glandulifera TaxID=253017 RepID=UPI001FB0F9CC|nr:uncharacterized protein LOC124910214 [Impatiens glandulifera]